MQEKTEKRTFWQDRYHATAVETGEHLRQCIVYFDLNMVRSDPVKHPAKWHWCGYNEIQHPRRKNILIDYEKLRELAGFESFDSFQPAHKKWVDDILTSEESKRDSQWTERIATGSNTFANNFLSQLGFRAKGRGIFENGQTYQVREEMEYNS
jgi:REP-associated tyrosine transposase